MHAKDYKLNAHFKDSQNLASAYKLLSLQKGWPLLHGALCLSPLAAVTKISHPGGLNNKCLFLTVWRLGNSRTRNWQFRCLARLTS